MYKRVDPARHYVRRGPEVKASGEIGRGVPALLPPEAHIMLEWIDAGGPYVRVHFKVMGSVEGGRDAHYVGRRKLFQPRQRCDLVGAGDGGYACLHLLLASQSAEIVGWAFNFCRVNFLGPR